MEAHNLVIFQGILQEVLELSLTISNVTKPPDPLPFYLLIGIHELVQRSVYLMLQILLNIEFEVSPILSPNRYGLESFQVRPKYGAIWSQYRILVEPDIVEVQPAVCSIAIVAHGSNEQREDRNSALDEVLEEIHGFVVVVNAEEVEEFPGIIPDSPV